MQPDNRPAPTANSRAEPHSMASRLVPYYFFALTLLRSFFSSRPAARLSFGRPSPDCGMPYLPRRTVTSVLTTLALKAQNAQGRHDRGSLPMNRAETFQPRGANLEPGHDAGVNVLLRPVLNYESLELDEDAFPQQLPTPIHKRVPTEQGLIHIFGETA
ncbi:hypothetical protein CKAH01_08148 [Colletotrichum kahawae]|uniref:Uncharacterized protein n=1 Tax=Colletotrichum kahawae TaxID=34407 RepID=A0AAD9Y3N5_COLKA|nr:hypothetical protein CKAH01_08148 [Colletotrichum kahawae]